jgi:hypothetical protein
LQRLDEQQAVPDAPVFVWITSELVHVAAHVPVKVTPLVEE